jgi:undecaprenyl pyrophosphate phosphatase UppP
MSNADRITFVCCITLALVLVATISVALMGLFYDRVDNNEIFKMIEPAFNMIVGAFVGTIAGIKIGRDDAQ